jgi:hypothetical protein
MTKKKNTGVEESNQGHRAKMNSSDRSGLIQDVAEGWTQVLSKSSKKKLRQELKQKVSSKRDSLSRRLARRSQEIESSPPTPPLRIDQENLDGEQAPEEALEGVGSNAKVKKPCMDKPERSKKSEESEMREADNGRDLADAMLNADNNGRWVRAPLRDVDPSVCAPDHKVIKQVVEMLRSDPSRMPVVEIGVPSTKRRERALKRLKIALSISYLEAERLLTSSALANTYGKQCFVHALAMGKYIRNGDNAEDVAESHRVYLREQLCRRGYTATQVNLALPELEASLGLWNITATEVQGWLSTQEAAYNQQQAQAQARQVSADRAGDAAGHICGRTCDSPGQTPAKVGDSIFNNPDRGSGSPNAGAGENDLTDASSWDKPPAVQKFLAIRQVVCQEALKLVQDMNGAQLLKAFDSQVARFSTVLQAIQLFPKTCKIQLELSEVLQREMDRAKVSIQELELGGRLFLADVFERSTDRVMMMAEGSQPNRQLAEAEVQRAYKSCGDANEAVQSVVQLMRELSVPTPSWRKRVALKPDTPSELGANYRIGSQDDPSAVSESMSARRKTAGRTTAKMAAQQEKGIPPAVPMPSSRYRNEDAISTLRKMLKTDPGLAALPAEQQLRMAARRVNRKIDFGAATKETYRRSSATKRTAGEREDDDDGDDEIVDQRPAASKMRKAKRNGKGSAAAGGGGANSGSDSSSSSSSRSDGEASAEVSGEDDDGEDVGSENSDDMGSVVGSEDDDSRESDEDYERGDGFCVSDGSADSEADKPPKSSRKGEQSRKKDRDVQSPSHKRSANVNSLGTPKKDEANVSVGQGGNVYFGEDELKKWTIGSEKYKQGFNWPAYIHHKQSYDNYCQFKGVHAARTFKSIIHAKLIPALCGFCGLKRLLWKTYEDATVILAVEKALRPSKSTDFALELKQIQIADDKECSLMQNYTCFFENFSYKVAEAEDANRSIKPNVVKTTFKAAVAGHEILKLWLEEVPWRGLDRANARLLRKLREVRSWEQLQRKGITSASKKQRADDVDSTEGKSRQEGRKNFRGTRAGKSYALRKLKNGRFNNGRKARMHYGASSHSDNKQSSARFPSKGRDFGRGNEIKRKHSGLDQRGESWHDNKELFECFNSPCHAPFCQRCGRHGHVASECRIPDDAPGINLRGYYQEEKKGKARIAGPPPRNNAGRTDDDSEDADAEPNGGKNNAQRGSSRRCLQ